MGRRRAENKMDCTTCADIPESAEADVLAKQSLPHCVEHFEDFGYYGDDLDSYHLKKCSDCGSYFVQHDWDHFEEGGAVGTRIERIDQMDAAAMIPKIIDKVETAEWLQSKYDLGKLKAELKRLQAP